MISHHSYGDRGLFGQSESGLLLPKTLSLLLRHDGIVVADPLSDLQRPDPGSSESPASGTGYATAQVIVVVSLRSRDRCPVTPARCWCSGQVRHAARVSHHRRRALARALIGMSGRQSWHYGSFCWAMTAA